MSEGNITKRGKKSWRLKFEKGRDDNDNRLIGYETFRGSKKDAKIRLTEILESRNKGSFVDRTVMTVGDYLKQWLADHAVHSVSRKTFERYSEIIGKHLVPALGAKKLSDLKPLAIQSYYSQALRDGRRDGKGGLARRAIYLRAGHFGRRFQDLLAARTVKRDVAHQILGLRLRVAISC